MRKSIITAAAAALILTGCNMSNPLLTESKLPFGAPEFDKIQNEHYMPAFEQGVAEAKAEIDAIVANPEPATFENTILALEYSGQTINNVAYIFYNVKEANTNDALEQIAQDIAPMMTEYSMYVSLNEPLFERVKAVYEQRESLGLDPDQMVLLDKTYKSFARNGANLSDEDKAVYSKWAEEASLLNLEFSKNALAASNAYSLHLTDEADLAGLPEFVKEMAAGTAAERGLEGWVFTLDAPSYGPFMKYSSRRDLREKMYMASSTKATSGEYDNREVIAKLIDLRIKMANMLGYETYADYVLEEVMAKDSKTVNDFLKSLMDPTLPYAKKDVKDVYKYAKANGFEGKQLMPWDFSYWSDKYRVAEYALNEEELKPYFQLESCIDAVFGLATKLYGLEFIERTDLPVYHPDVKVYEINDENGDHMALLYADYFPRASKRSGAWMTSFRGQGEYDGQEVRPIINVVTNFTKPTATAPSLITHDEFTTLLHEFGHALHGILAEGRYPSLTGTSVPRDFVELPSQIMENWAFESEYLNSFAKHYQTGETIPAELVEKIVNAKNYLAAYGQVRQLQLGMIDMAWHSLKEVPGVDAVEFEAQVVRPTAVMPIVAGCATSPQFSHIFAGGYAAGYYSYKWAEVLEADAFSYFKEKGIFNKEVAAAFRDNVLSRGGSDDAAVLYRNFRGHEPDPNALMEKLGLKK